MFTKEYYYKNILISRVIKSITEDDYHFWEWYDDMHEWLLSRPYKTSFYRQLIFNALKLSIFDCVNFDTNNIICL